MSIHGVPAPGLLGLIGEQAPYRSTPSRWHRQPAEDHPGPPRCRILRRRPLQKLRPQRPPPPRALPPSLGKDEAESFPFGSRLQAATRRQHEDIGARVLGSQLLIADATTKLHTVLDPQHGCDPLEPGPIRSLADHYQLRLGKPSVHRGPRMEHGVEPLVLLVAVEARNTERGRRVSLRRRNAG